MMKMLAMISLHNVYHLPVSIKPSPSRVITSLNLVFCPELTDSLEKGPQNDDCKNPQISVFSKRTVVKASNDRSMGWDDDEEIMAHGIRSADTLKTNKKSTAAANKRRRM
jgi:hypothetical protein